MSELTLLILRIGFLVLLWFFILAIVFALRSDLFGTPATRMRADGQAAKPAPPGNAAQQVDAMLAASAASARNATAAPVITPSGGAMPSAGPATGAPGAASAIPNTGQRLAGARQLVITSGIAAGTALPLDEDVLTIGRSNDSTLVIVDEYTSTYHAKLARQGAQWVLTDLDSTNGTRLNGSRITGAVSVPLYMPITIGTTTFELRP